MTHVILTRGSNRDHPWRFVETDESFFVKFGVVFRGVFIQNHGPKSDSALANETSPSVKGPALNFTKQGRIANKPFVPETKSLVGAFDTSGLVAFAGAPIQTSANRFRIGPNDAKDIVRKNHFPHVLAKDT